MFSGSSSSRPRPSCDCHPGHLSFPKFCLGVHNVARGGSAIVDPDPLIDLPGEVVLEELHGPIGGAIDHDKSRSGV